MEQNNEQKKADILAESKNEETLSVSASQKRFEIGCSLEGETFAQKTKRRSGRAELHLHTTMSAFGGLDDARRFFKEASARGVSAIAVTDLGSVQSYPAAIDASKRYGIKALFGSEFFVDGQAEGDAHRAVVLAKNTGGIKRIYDLVTVSETTSKKENTPFLPFDELARAREDILIGLVACDKGIATMLEGGFDENATKLFSSFDYIEIAPIEVCSILLEDDSKEYCQAFLKRVLSIALDAKVPVIASDDACYLEVGDAFEAGAIDHSRTLDSLRKKSIKEPLIKGRYFRSTQEMLDSFSFLGEEKAKEIVVDMPNKISALIKDMTPFENNGELIPLFPDADRQIGEICHERLEKMFAKGCPIEYWSRLKEELRAIKNTHSASAFLTCHLIAKKAKEDGRMISSRGMAGNSFVAYLLGIAEINPLEPYYYCPKCGSWAGYVHEFHHGIASSLEAMTMRCLECGARLSCSGEDLPMEMLFGLEGEKVPDIDLVFSSGYLSSIHDYLRDLFGKDNVARVSAIVTLPRKSSELRARDYLKGSEAEGDGKCYERAVGAVMAPKRLMEQRPCGYVVLPKGHTWNEFTPLEHPLAYEESRPKITHYPWEELSALGQLYKFDLLGSVTLELLERLVKETGIDINAVRLDDKRFVDVLCGKSEETTLSMIPGYSGEIMRKIISIAKPMTFADLVKVEGLALGSGVWEYYEDKLASGEISISDEMVANRDDLFLSLLSHGVNRDMAFEIADRVRKGRGLTAQLAEAMKAHGLAASYIEACGSARYLSAKAYIIASLRRELLLAYFKLQCPEPYERIYAELFD